LGTAWAHNAEVDEAPQINEVIITARPLDDRSLLAPAQQLSGAALTQRQGSTLGETLDNLPGIANSSFGPNVGRPVIRGMEGDRVRILQNSGANLDVSGLSTDHAVPIDPLTTERIEVLRGPAALLYSGGAMGENIAAGYSSGAEVVAGWLSSDGHCRNMMDPDFGVIGIGVTFVIVTGGIDLSIGSVICLVGCGLPWLLTVQKWSLPAALVAVVVVSVGIGLIHGLLITRLKLQPFIVTLCGLMLYRGITRGFTGDQTVGFGDGYKGHIRQAEAGATRAMRAFNASSLCGPIKGVVLLRVNEHRTTMTHHRCGCVNDKVFDHRPGHNLRNKAEARLHGRHFSTHFAVRGLLRCPKCCSFVDRDVNGALNIARAGEAEWLYGPSARPAHLQRQARKPGDRPPAVPGTWVLRSSRLRASGHPD
jgi:hypothetical protein